MSKELEFLLNIVKEANKISEKQFEVKQKGNYSDLVTNLDLEIEKYLIEQIKANYPDFDIVSEEFNTNNEVTDNCFIIDPIDGTINFANNVPLWAIQIAMRVDGETVASVISMPRINELYYADKSGAYLNDKKISVREVPIKNALYAIDGNNNLGCLKRMRNHSYSKRYFGGVCVSMAFTAAGRIHGAVFRSDKPWDYEPGLFICEMAGAKIKNVSGFHAAAMNEEFLNILEKETAKRNKNIFILHSLNGDTLNIWGQDIKETFEDIVDISLPKFPIRAEYTYDKFNEILKPYLNKELKNNTIVICHSIGNPYFMRFAKENNYKPYAYIAVAPGGVYYHKTDRTDYIVDIQKQSYVNDDVLEYIKNMDSIKYCIYSDQGEEHEELFKRFIKDTNSIDMYLKYYNHFDGYHRIYKIPELNELIDKLLEN